MNDGRKAAASIYRQFWGIGTNSEVLYLDAANPSFAWMPMARGFRPVDNQTCQVQDIFDWTQHYNDWCWAASCADYSAPQATRWKWNSAQRTI